jgi:hypothetical protein
MTIWKAILKHSQRIKKEKPSLYKKVKEVVDINLEDIYQ